MLLQGKIILPTLSDKKTWGYIDGLTLPGLNMEMPLSGQFLNQVTINPNGSYTFSQNQEVLDQLRQYAILEHKAVLQTLKDVKGYTDENGVYHKPLTNAEKIENYHTAKVKVMINGEERSYLIAAHYLKDFRELSTKDKKVKRNRGKTGIASNRWDEAKLYPVIDLKFIKQYDIKETVIFEYDDIMYKMDIVEVPTNFKDLYLYPEDTKPKDTLMPLAYIRRKTTEPFPEQRIYTNNPDRLLDPYTTKGLKMVYKIDIVVAYLKENGWIAGSTNIDMNTFDNIYSKLKLLR